MGNIVTRFAPSPTGYLHIGGVRTALFNYVYAKKNDGKFLVRIEDTDKERSKEEYVEAIMDGLAWVGLIPDTEPIKQSNRFDTYQKEAQKLLEQGKAYKDEGAIRLAVEKKGTTTVKDLVYGEIEFANTDLDDLVILRSNGSPTYHFCNVIDDNFQKVTHVVRGEDHLPNTPKQIQIVKALGYEGFKYAHLPLVLGEDRKRLSKRHAATDLMAYKDIGYLPDALLNMLSRIGWSRINEEVFSMEEMKEVFDLKDIQRAGGVFDLKRLNFVNQSYMAKLNDDEIIKELESYCLDEGFKIESTDENKTLVRLCIGSGANLKEIAEYLKPFFLNYFNYEEGSIEKHLLGSEDIFWEVKSKLEKLVSWGVEDIDIVIDEILKEFKIPMPKLGLPLRVALLGRTKSPPLNVTIYLLGKEKCIGLLKKTIDFIAGY